MHQGSTDLKEYLEAKANGLGRWGYQLQPHVVVLSDDFGDADVARVAYTCIHSTVYYETTSVLEAVDIALKSTFVLGLQYPAPAHTTWSFMQKAVYKLSHRFDRIPSKVHVLITDMQ